jgi:hypothetical protein
MLHLASRYTMHRVLALTTPVVEYWGAVKQAGLLRHRLFDTVDPDINDVKEMLDYTNNVCYIMYDEAERRVCADTMLNNVSGLVAQVHFSIHPDYLGRRAIEICRAGAEQHFRSRINTTGETLGTLFGITPVENFLAIRLIKRVGFKPITVLNKVCFMAERRLHVDGLLTILKSEDLYGR